MRLAMSKSVLSAAFILMAPLALSACVQNPMGDPVWSGWDQGGKPVAATDEAAQPTGSISPAATTGYGQTGYSQSGYGQAGGPPAALESAPLPPPPGSTAAPPDGPRADAAPPATGPDPYESHYGQPARAIMTSSTAAVGKPLDATPHPAGKVTQRTAPLVVSGEGVERKASE
jgi:hypothetical protein